MIKYTSRFSISCSSKRQGARIMKLLNTQFLLVSFQHIFTLFEYNLLIYFVGLHALLIIIMIFGPFGKAWLAIVSHLFFFADVLSVVQGFPVEFNHSVASVGVEKRNPTAATWTSPGKFTGV